MSTRIYCDQCGTETSKREALRFSLSGYSANRTSMGQLNDIEIDVNVTAWKIGLVIIMRGTATPTARVSHPECFGRFTALALSCDGAIRKCMRRVAMMCARHSACERLDRQEARG